MRGVVPLIALSSALACSGCGDAHAGERATIRGVLVQDAIATNHHDAATLCRLRTPASRSLTVVNAANELHRHYPQGAAACTTATRDVFKHRASPWPDPFAAETLKHRLEAIRHADVEIKGARAETCAVAEGVAGRGREYLSNVLRRDPDGRWQIASEAPRFLFCSAPD
jgi:hypothetical protein